MRSPRVSTVRQPGRLAGVAGILLFAAALTLALVWLDRSYRRAMADDARAARSVLATSVESLTAMQESLATRIGRESTPAALILVYIQRADSLNTLATTIRALDSIVQRGPQ